MITGINSEDRLVQQTFADHLRDCFKWDSVYAYNDETFGPTGTLGRANEREIILTRDLRAAPQKLNPELPPTAVEDAIQTLTTYDFSRTTLQRNRDFYRLIRDGVPVSWHNAAGETCNKQAQVIDFRTPGNNRFLAVRELKIQGLRTPHYNRRADLVCFVNGIPIVFVELKAVYRNIRAGYDNNLSDYADTIPHAFYHNAFLVVSNGDKARYGSITSQWKHFSEWKRQDEKDKGDIAARVLLDGMLEKSRLLDLAAKLDAEQKRAIQEGLSEDELALFDLLQKDKLNNTARERVKQASRQLLTTLTAILASMQQWTAKERTQAEIKTLILDQLYEALPIPPFTEQETDAAAARIYDYVWQRCAAGQPFTNVT